MECDGSGGKAVVMLTSFAVFAAGVWALFRNPGPLRSTVLGASLAILIVIALWITLRRWKGGKGN